MPGQIESLYINLKNYGYGAGHSVRAGLSSINPYGFVLIDTVRYREIPPETLKYAPEPFVVYISPFCPLPYISKFLLNIYSENYLFTDTISVLIGESGFSDDMESGTGLWTTGGLNNLWHISNRRYFSQSHSWYCGNDTSGKYVNNMNCYIQTIPFMIQKNSLLKFYRWFQVPIYGSDGIYIIVMHNSLADTLDFIGTGGALKQRPIQSDWFCEKYLLDDYSAGDSIQIRISFVSDNDGKTGEGFYIDDVVVEYNTDIEEFNMKPAVQNLKLEIQPNPFKNSLTIKFQIPNLKSHITKENVDQDFSLKIYDVTGRLVYNFSQLTKNDGSSMVVWSGEDNTGRRLAAGIYFVQLEVESYKRIEKVIFLK